LSRRDLIEDIYPLSPVQQGMLFHTLSNPGSGQYVVQLSCLLSGGVDVAAFRTAWEGVVERHPALRTVFVQRRDQPVQVVYRRVQPPWREEDWRGLSPEAQEERFAALLRDDLRQGFDLVKPPLLRFTLLRLGPDSWRFLWTAHHLLMDGWSFPLVLREVFRLYQAARRGEPAGLPPVRPYSAYIDWLRGRRLEDAEAFWRRDLRGFTEPTPVGPVRPGEAETEGSDFGRRRLALDEETTERLTRLARRERVTPGVVIQAAWALLLADSSGTAEDDVLFGLTFAGRPEEIPGVESIVGPFLNSLPSRIRIDREAPLASLASLGDWLREIQARQTARLAHAWAPLSDVQSWSEVPRGTPLFESLVIIENYPVDNTAAGSADGGNGALRVSDLRTDERTHYAVSLAVVPGRRMSLILTFDRARLDAMAALRLLERFAGLLVEMTAEGGAVRGLTGISEAERHQTLAEWNDTARPLPPLAFHELFAARAAATPDAPAVIGSAGEMTWRELDRRANDLALRLRAFGVEPEVRVGLLAERSPELLVGILGILKAGGVYVPLDPEHPEERIAFLAEDAELAILVTGEGMEAPASLPFLPGVEIGSGEADAPPETTTDPDRLAYLLYTSGSTGRPKAVMVPHRGIANLAAAQSAAFGLGPDDRILQFASPTFDASVSELAMAAWSGAALGFAGRDEILPGPPLAALIRERRITCVTLPPSSLAALAALGDDTSLPVRVLIVAGEACPTALAERWAAGRALFNAYGPTEATVCATIEPFRNEGELALGRPIANVRVRLLDRESRPVPIGMPGEICLGGPGLARGYHGRPDLTAERFVPDPFGEPGERLYRTGDLARHLDDGRLVFLGRIDRQWKIRGVRVEPGEIEAELTALSGVREAAVVPREEPGGAGWRLVAFVAGDGDPEPGALRDRLRERLPEVLVPAEIVLVDRLPLTPNGKIDRAALSRLEIAGGAARLGGEGGEPRTPTEELLAEIWADVLGLPGVARGDRFLDIGGHSLIAAQVVARIQEAFGVDLALDRIFDAPSLAALAAEIDEARAAGAGLEAPPLERRPREGPPPLSFAQERLWFLHQLAPADPSYNIPIAVRLAGPLDAPALEAALREVARRHETLRTVFVETDAGPAQSIRPEPALDLPEIDLSGLPAEIRAAETERIVVEGALRPFDLATGPLVRASLLRLEPEQHVLLVALHHVVADGWSMGVMVREAGALYSAFLEGRLDGRPSPLPELPVQYADYAIWERGWLRGAALASRLAAARRRLEGMPEMLELPTDRPRPAVRTSRGDAVPVPLPEPLAAEVRAFARREGATLFMVLLAAWSALLARLSGAERIPIGFPVAHRSRPELEGLIGFFVNTLVLPADLTGDPPFRELVARIRAAALEGFDHQDLPFERLVEELRPERTLSRTPLFQVMFAFQDLPRQGGGLARLALEPLPVRGGISRFDLTLTVSGGGGALHGTLEYNRDLFDRTTALRFAAAFERLLAAAIESPARLSELPLLSDAERQQLRVEWNEGDDTKGGDAVLHELVAARAARAPAAPAVTFEGETLSYGDLERRAGVLARRLRALGIGPEVRVAICAERSIEMIVGLLAILKAGGAYVPLDPAYPDERLAWMLADSGVRAVLTQAPLAGRMAALASETPQILLEEDGDAPDLPLPEVSPDHAAYVIYTSGSTGRPKGVVVTHRNVARLLDATDPWFRFGPDDVWTLFHSYAFDFSVWEIWGALATGGRLVVVPYWVSRSPEDFYRLLVRERVTVLNQTPSAFGQLVQAEEALGAAPDLALRTVVFGGEALDIAMLAPWWERHLADRPRLVNMYGITETTVHVTVRPLSPGDPPGRIGRAMPDLSVRIVDRGLREAPIGVAGELGVGGAGLARGYLNRPDLTAERFVPDPFSGRPGARLYRSGDLARRRPDGDLEHLGRIDAQVKIRGHRIEPGEVEAALRSLPEVADAAAGVRPGPGGQELLVAWIVAADSGREPHAPDAAALRAALALRLPEPMIPARFVALPALPLTVNGKLDRKALPDPGAPGAAAVGRVVPPRTEPERRILEVWKEVLAMDEIGVESNFFDLGGNSLLVARVRARLRGAHGREVPIVDLFRFPTVAALARHLEEERPPETAGRAERARARVERRDEEEATPLRRARRNRSEGGGA
jgi:amino acid adenylation domain-containing protein